MPLVGALQLRARSKVSWLELFFDLIFVAAVAQVAEPLRHHYTLDGVFRFAALFALIWWAWSGYTTFATRFESDDGVQRALTVVQVFVVAAMAANARDTLDSRSTAGFAAAYAVLRLLLVGQYARARHLPHARGFTDRCIAGHGCAALLFLASSVTPAPWRYGMWAVALLVDLSTPWLAITHAIRIPPVAAHLPERVGLFTLILLGEAVVAVMKGMESQETWPLPAALSAFMGMGLLFLLWWWYFDRIDAVAERHVRTRADAVRLLLWSYAHFPLYLGIVVTGVGVQRLIAAASRVAVAEHEVVVLLAGAASTAVAMLAIRGTLARQGLSARRLDAVRALAFAAVVLVAVFGSRVTSPPLLVLALLAVVASPVLFAGGAPEPG